MSKNFFDTQYLPIERAFFSSSMITIIKTLKAKQSPSNKILILVHARHIVYPTDAD